MRVLTRAKDKQETEGNWAVPPNCFALLLFNKAVVNLADPASMLWLFCTTPEQHETAQHINEPGHKSLHKMKHVCVCDPCNDQQQLMIILLFSSHMCDFNLGRGANSKDIGGNKAELRMSYIHDLI